MVDALALIQIPSSGRKFTWANNRRRGNVAAVLDRTFVNEEWMKIFDDCIQKVLIRVASDHAPLMACSVSSIKPKNYPLRLNSFWMDHHQFLDVIKEAWHNNFSGSPPFILAQKLKALKPIIKSWSREAFPNLDQEVITSKAELENIQRSIEEDGLTEQLFDQEADAKTKYWKAMENQEKLWLQKSRVRWLKEGDRCSRFFHVMTRIKRSKNTIRCITTEDGVDISDRDQMGSYLAKFYETFHKKVDLEDHPQIFNCIPKILQDSDQVMLDAIPSEEEIKRVVWDLDPDSSPGPDGFTGVFFRKCWDIIHDDVYRAVKGFFFISILPKIILQEQGAFQKGKLIQTNICLASELANLIGQTSRGGNLGLKSARISVLLNGDPVGFFEVSRGLRQGDPISPILFIIAEEVLCHGMSDLATKSHIKPLSGPRGADVPTHLLFADDVFIFINASKRKQWIAEELEIPCYNFPTKYLGVEIFQGRVKRDPLLPVMDKIKAKLAGWKGKLLSMAGTVELVKSVISGITLHNFSVYWWPSPLIRNLEKWMRNFIWTGEIDSSKATTVKWDTICKPKEEGGLGIRRLREVNMTLIAKLAWSIKAEDSQLSSLLRARFLFHSGLPKRSYRRSSIWPDIRRMWKFISDNERWIIGSGRKINFWNDNWLGPKPIAVLSELNEELFSNLNQTVADFIVDGSWVLPPVQSDFLAEIFQRIEAVKLPYLPMEDRCVWSMDSMGTFSVNSAWNSLSVPQSALTENCVGVSDPDPRDQTEASSQRDAKMPTSQGLLEIEVIHDAVHNFGS
ncbi:uncharacterized protein LOC122088975 [Macadamia integrifolia]|uniref:uncharacterized protein LOC122088975 n=1 Tax=Macadamia integrifolia TaxID=60698 RepID=UPI001C4EF749|nr:uncharacterized protein LOC122088975 [Macadamia integrifolia]